MCISLEERHASGNCHLFCPSGENFDLCSCSTTFSLCTLHEIEFFAVYIVPSSISLLQVRHRFYTFYASYFLQSNISDKIFELFILHLTHRNIFDPIQCNIGNLKLPSKSNSGCIFHYLLLFVFIVLYLFISCQWNAIAANRPTIYLIISCPLSLWYNYNTIFIIFLSSKCSNY